MKKPKDRVIAIDYFRGVCILMVLLNHATAFAMPFAYLAGAGRLWTSAAEMFFLLSGITLAVVRGGLISKDFKNTAINKFWKNALRLYLLDVGLVIASVMLALIFAAHGVSSSIQGVPSDYPLKNLLIDTFTLKYSVGLANFLMFYAVYMLFAPFCLWLLYTKRWALVPGLSALLFALVSLNIISLPNQHYYLIWQLYFFAGLTLGRFRLNIIGYLYNLKPRTFKILSISTFLLAAVSLTVNVLLSFNISPAVTRLAESGWLPVKVQAAYIKLLESKPTLDGLLIDSRMGILRPLAALLTLFTAYLLYQKYKNVLLARTGKFINKMGSNTLWIFAAQAIVIPLLAVLPVPRNFYSNFLMTTALVMIMWLLAQRRSIAGRIRTYMKELKYSYDEAKYSYLSQFEENS